MGTEGQLLEQAIRHCCEASTDYHSFRTLPLPAGADALATWKTVNALRYTLGIALPFSSEPHDAAERPDWLFVTRRLHAEAADYLANALNNPHTSTTLLLPEGRHVKLALLIRDCAVALEDCGCDLPFDRFSNLALGLENPSSPSEQLVINCTRAAMSITGDQTRLTTATDVVELYERCVAGIPIDPPGLSNAAGGATHGTMPVAAIDSILRATEHLDMALRGPVRMQAFLERRPFPVANAFVGRMLFASDLRQSGLALASYLPILEFIHAWRRKAPLAHPCHQPRCPFADAVQPFGATHDWTRYFEELFAYLADELRWFIRKLGRMRLRRRRVEELLASDTRYNERQHDVLVEALVHDDAEFTFEDFVDRYGVAYSTAHTDLTILYENGFLRTSKRGKRFFFIASEDIKPRVHSFLRRLDPNTYASYFRPDGKLAELDGHSKEGKPTAIAASEETGKGAPLLFSLDSATARPAWPLAEPTRRLSILKGERDRFACHSPRKAE